MFETAIKRLEEMADVEDKKATAASSHGFVDDVLKYTHGTYCYFKAIEILKEVSRENSDKMQELKESILGEMEEFQSEYRKYSESSVDYHGGRADAMGTAMRIVKVAFRKAMGKVVG